MTRNWPEQTKVLLVEDDFLTARMLQARLEMEGLTVLFAVNGVEALSKIQEERVDIVITDLMMPAMNGYRLIQEIRELPAPHGTVPILVMSSNQNESDIVDCFKAGGDDFMAKPLSMPLMMERIWSLHRRIPRGT
jgi:DNA-binding response OmpR family regulator